MTAVMFSNLRLADVLFLAALGCLTSLRPVTSLPTVFKRSSSADHCVSDLLCPATDELYGMVLSVERLQKDYLRSYFNDQPTLTMLQRTDAEQIPHVTDYAISADHWVRDFLLSDCDQIASNLHGAKNKLRLLLLHLNHVIELGGYSVCSPGDASSRCRFRQPLYQLEAKLVSLMRFLSLMTGHSNGGRQIEAEPVDPNLLPVVRADDTEFHARVHTYILLRDLKIFQTNLLCSLIEMVPAGWRGCGHGLKRIIERCT